MSGIGAAKLGEIVENSFESVVQKRISTTISQSYGSNSPLTSRAVLACLLLRVREFVFSDIETILKELGLTHTRYQVLSVVCRSPRGLQLSEIATLTFVQPSTMTTTIDRLKRDGLINRRSTPKDRRAIIAIATQQGHHAYNQARTALTQAEFGMLGIDDETVEVLIDRLDKAAVTMEQRCTTLCTNA